MAWLVAVGGELGGRRYSLAAPCLVGRGPYNHIVIDDARVSRQHAKVSPEAGGHVIYDLNSANGTFVNDVQVRRQKLEPNDVVRFGPFVFRFEGGREVALPKVGRVPEVMTQIGIDLPPEIIQSMAAEGATTGSFVVTPDLAELEDAHRKLGTLHAFLQSVATTLESGPLIERILKNLLDVFPTAERTALYLLGAERRLTLHEALGRDGKGGQGPAVGAALPANVQEELMASRAVLSEPVERTSRRGGLGLYAPMIFDGDVLGALHVHAELGQGFDQRDLDLLSGLAAQAAMALQNSRMHQESLRHERLQRDLLLAQEIQKSFLPRRVPKVPGLEFYTEYRPAYSVGGDCYDLFWLDERRIGVFIGDVSGKGVSAALLMARISSDLRVAALEAGSPAQAIARVNQAVLQREQDHIFITGIYLTLDVVTRQVTLANAGHLPPLLRHRGVGALERIELGGGTAIGIFDDATYAEAPLQLAPGDTLVLCTDGILEATDGTGQQFGFERLERSVAVGPSRPRELAKRLERDLQAHVRDASQYDDLTLIIIGVADEPQAS